MKTIAIKQITRDDGSIANQPDYEGNWPPSDAISPVRSDGTNYTYYAKGEEDEYAQYLSSLAPDSPA